MNKGIYELSPDGVEYKRLEFSKGDYIIQNKASPRSGCVLRVEGVANLPFENYPRPFYIVEQAEFSASHTLVDPSIIEHDYRLATEAEVLLYYENN